MKTYCDLRPALIRLVRVQAGLCLLVGVAAFLFGAVLSSEASRPDSLWTRHDANVAGYVSLVAVALGIVLLVSMHTARDGSANGRACLVCVEVLLLMVTLAFTCGGGLAGLPALLLPLNGVTLGFALVENNRRPVTWLRRD